jgi:membrane protease YdiL (CAAX protease family)
MESRDVWRLVLGCIVFIATLYALGYGYSVFQAMVLNPNLDHVFRDDLANAGTPLAVIVLLFLFIFMIAALWVSLRIVHNRALMGLFGPKALAWSQFRKVMLAVLTLYAVLALLPVPEDLQMSRKMPFAVWLGWLAPALVALAIQVTAEEVVFRGYLQSQLAARFRSPIVWMGVPSILFALLHYGNSSDSSVGWLIVLWAGLFGLAAADLTARSGTLGPAIALHFMNNFSAILLAAPEGDFDGLALYSLGFSLSDYDLLLAWTPVEIMVLICSWLAARLALKR